MKEYVYLLIAIIGELIGTTLLKASDGFSKLFLRLLALFSYASRYFFFSKYLRTISLGAAYAIWSGIGIVVTTVIGTILWKEKTNPVTVLAIIMTIIGIILLNLITTNK